VLDSDDDKILLIWKQLVVVFLALTFHPLPLSILDPYLHATNIFHSMYIKFNNNSILVLIDKIHMIVLHENTLYMICPYSDEIIIFSNEISIMFTYNMYYDILKYL